MPFVGGPNTHITNPRWRKTAILEKSKNRHISAAVSPKLTKFGTVTQFDPDYSVWKIGPGAVAALSDWFVRLMFRVQFIFKNIRCTE